MVPGWLILTYVTFIGACVGSFLNVVIARLPEEESIIRPRSRCPRCKTPIAWYDNIPLLSYLLLLARCRHCKAPIALRYPLVEVLMALLSAALYLRFGLSWDLLLWWPLTAALLAITFLDIDHWWVPNLITYPAMIFALAVSFAPGGLSPVQSLIGLVPAAGLLGVGWLYQRVRGREGMGLGDIKLMAVIGLALGAWDAVVVIFLASAQGAVIGVVVMLTGGHRAKGDEVDTEGGSEVEADPGGAADTDDAIEAPADPEDEDRDEEKDDDEDDDEDDWVPPKGAFPFGPVLVLATLERVLLPDTFANSLSAIANALTSLLFASGGGP